ncbi:hypothetical protein D3C79_954920 [compost metagenome]
MRAAANKWRDAQRRMVAESEAGLIEQLKAKGMQINQADKAAFAQAVAPVWKTYEVQYGPELMALVAKYRK